MFKKLFLSLSALMMGWNAWAGDTPVITVADVEALPGETVSFSVNFVDGKADTYTAVTLYAYFPKTGFTTTGSPVISSVWEGTTGVTGDINAETGLATITFASANAIHGSAVDNLLQVKFTVDESVAVGEYDVTLKQTMFEYNPAGKDYAADVTFKVKVVNAHSVVLDETSTVAPEAAEGVNVTVKRTVNANVWSTICLPFAMSEAQVKAAFGDDVQLGDFNGYETEEDGEGNIVSIAVKFVTATAIEANHPYIIKVSAPVTEFTADGVDIDPEEKPTKAAVKRTKKQWSEMIGTYVANTPVGDADADGWCLFLSGGKFWYSKGNTKMKAYRAYFDFYDVLTEVEEGASARMYISFDPATGIEKTEVTGSAEGVYYDLQGRKVMNPVKGMFIKDHKKVIVK